jgi:hypothetical protein
MVRELGSSVSTVTGYGLGDRASIPEEAEDFTSTLCVQTGSGAHPACCTMGLGSSYPGGKVRPGRDAVEAKKDRGCNSSPSQGPFMACSGSNLPTDSLT